MKHALEGIKVVDFGMFLAGPVGGRLLADLGASVIKVEPTEGESLRPISKEFELFHKTFTQAQAGKRDIAIDLKYPEGLAIAHQLIAEADIVQENFRPGVADRLGVGYEDCKKINPKVIYVSSPGYGSHGPRREYPGFEPLYSGFCGIHYNSGGKGNPPSRSASFDQFCGLLCANAILMALHHRDMTGEGQYVEVAQLKAVLYFVSEAFFLPNGKMGAETQVDANQTGFSPMHRLYQTLDDWIMVAFMREKEWQNLCKAIELPDLVTDPRFSSYEKREANGEDLAAVLQDQFFTKETGEWFSVFEANGVPSEVPLIEGEDLAMMNDDLLKSGAVAEHEHPWWGMVHVPGVAVKLSETPGISRGPAPMLGQHTDEILKELGYPPARIEELAKKEIIVLALGG